jgi:hypothetical protein
MVTSFSSTSRRLKKPLLAANHGLPNDGFPLLRVGLSDIAQIDFVMFSRTIATTTSNERMHSRNGRPLIGEWADVHCLRNAAF